MTDEEPEHGTEAWLALRGWARMEEADPADDTITWWHPDHPTQVDFDTAVTIEDA